MTTTISNERRKRASGWGTAAYLLWVVLWWFGLVLVLEAAASYFGAGWVRYTAYGLAWVFVTLWPAYAFHAWKKRERERHREPWEF